MSEDVQIPDTPEEFFTKIVPHQFASLAVGVDNGPGAICFDITGHGQWSMCIRGGKVMVDEGINEETLVHITFEGAEWQVAAKQLAGGGVGPLGGSGGGMTSVIKNPAAASTLKAAQGTLKIVTKDDDGDHWVAITLGGAEPNLESPRATLTMTREVAEQMASGQANPQELFMSGKIQITGDMMMLMQLAPMMG